MSKRIIKNLFHYADKQGADNLIIENNNKEISFSYNFPDGETQNFGLPKKLEASLTENLRQVLKVAPGELVNRKYCKIYDKNYHLRFYLNVLPAESGEKIIINIIKRNPRLWRLKQLGLQRGQYKELKKTSKKNSGLIIISSPDGEGKSTTMYSLLQELNTNTRNTYLLDSTPEYKLDNINQLKLNKTNWNRVVSHDSDIIALDDINDDKTLQEAIKAVVSGRLVILTTSAKSSWEVLLRILKLKMPLSEKLEALDTIINQRIVKLKRAKKKNEREEIALFEVLTLNADMKKYILDSRHDPEKEKFWESLVILARANGFKTLGEDLEKKTKDGLIDL